MASASYSRQLGYEVRRSLDTATINTTYVKLGGALLSPGSLVKMVNLSNINVDVSIDGTNDHDICPANGYWLYDVTSDSPQESGSVFEPTGRQFWIKATGGVAGVGLVYLVVRPVLRF